MKVLIVTGIFPPDRGGPASYVPRIATALTGRGHRVEVVCLSDQLDHDDRAYSFQVHRLRRSLFWPCRVLWTAFTVWRAARRNDVVYINGLGAEAALGAWLAARPAVHKIVGDYAWERATGRRWFRGTIDEYQSAAKGLALRVLDGIRTIPLLFADEIIVPSRYLQRIVEGWAIPRGKVRVIYNSAERAEPGASPIGMLLPAWSGRTLITVCRLVPWKGVDSLIRLIAKLPETRLVVAGGGHLRAELEELARTVGVAARVLFLGDVPHQQVPETLRQADAFVLNSTYEGLPHVVLEAMAAAVPVIATDAGGTHEVVEHEETGLLVPVGDEAALHAAVERLWNDRALGSRLAAEATRRLGGQFDFESMVARTEVVLAAAIEPVRGTVPLPAKES